MADTPLVDNRLKASVAHLENFIFQEIDESRAACAIDQTDLQHFFVPTNAEYGCGMYSRQLTVPKDLLFTGKIHRHAHMTFLLKGELLVTSETGRKHIKAPHTWVTPCGAKRAFYALEESILTNVHLTKHPQLEKLQQIEDEVIAPSYTEMGLAEADLNLLLE